VARAFSLGAFEDGLTRAGAMLNLTPQRLDDEDWVRSLVDWAKAEGLEQIVTAYAPQGPVAERLAAAFRKLEPMGVHLAVVQRRWDETAWPHATKGFFQFRDVIPKLARL